ncbi:MAG: hypothetical protein HRT92_08475 [Piscirickettsiaceae bacterium]|nr:hypothetical protein [Piscirickettsiaceae bacterium]
MTIFNAITHSQSLLKQVSSRNNDAKITALLDSLLTELEHINTFAHQLTSDTSISSQTTPEIKSGCYIFANEKVFYCPNCYDNDAKKVATKRMNSKLRVCPSCRASIR